MYYEYELTFFVLFCSFKPKLNVRTPLADNEIKHPRPIVLDTDLRILTVPTNDILLRHPIICTCVDKEDMRFAQAVEKLRSIDGTLLYCKKGLEGRCDYITT